VNCLLIRELPFGLAMRLWDTYLAEGTRMKVSMASRARGDAQGPVISMKHPHAVPSLATFEASGKQMNARQV
jgi:hypothetical protein